MLKKNYEFENYYTLKELSHIFKVSTITIKKWIEEKRFNKYIYEQISNQILINQDSQWTSPTGKVFKLEQLDEICIKENETKKDISFLYQFEFFKNYLLYFEQQYGGSYEEIFGNIENTDLNYVQIDDKETWLYIQEVLDQDFTIEKMMKFHLNND